MIDKQFIITPDEWTDAELNAPELPADEEWPAEPGDEQCIFEQVANARLVKPTGPCVRLTMPNGDVWRV